MNGDRLDERYGGPEYETTAAFGSLCMISDLKAICLANNKCNAYGLDTIGTGSAIAFAMEASERGLLQNGPAWGSPEDMLAWIDKIALRQGPGDMLAQGVVNAARQLGCEDLGVHIKGVEVPMHEPRGKKSLAISYATSPRGANHMETVHDDAWSHLDTLPAELRIVPHSDRFALDEHKAHICKRFTDLVSFANSLVLCAFYTFDCNWGGEYRLPQVRELLHAATGMRLDAEDMFTIGERNYVLLKHLAFESGYTRQDDDLPHRLKQPLGKGNSAGQTIDSTLLHHVIDTYYSIRGYLPGGGVSREKLAELSLSGLPRRSANHAARSKEE